MKMLNVANGPQNVSSIILGCMRMPALSVDAAEKMIQTAVDLGINFFDNATCYGENGEAETRFGDAFAQSGIRREDVYIQTKCGLCFNRGEFDWTKENILSSVDDSLRRMKLDYLDALLLHRPDLIYEPQQVAEAFDILEKSGKVRWFGVSNVPPMMLEVLRKYMKQPLVFNQLQFSLEQAQLVDQALYVNNKSTELSVDRDNGMVDYCRLHDITIQAWSMSAPIALTGSAMLGIIPASELGSTPWSIFRMVCHIGLPIYSMARAGLVWMAVINCVILSVIAALICPMAPAAEAFS